MPPQQSDRQQENSAHATGRRETRTDSPSVFAALNRLDRRRFLGVAGAAGIAATGLGTLTACTTGTSATGKGAEGFRKVKLPTYVPANVAPADLAGNAQGLDAAYLRYPKKLVRSVPKPPGDGESISALTETFTTPAPAMDRNRYWKELNKRLGSDLKMNIVVDSGADAYLTKFNAIIASGDIPDLVWFPPNQGLRKVPQLLQAKFHDLTSHLSGDAIKKYPNLANLPDYAWKTAVINGKIAGVPVAYGRMGQIYVVNEDFWKPVGGYAFDSAQDFLDKGKELLDTRRKKYVLEPAYVNAHNMFAQWFGAPSSWRLDGGKLTARYETDEYREALEFAVKVFKAGLFWPDPNLTTTREKMAQGTLGAYVQSFPSFLVDVKTYEFPFGVIVPFAAKPGVTAHFDFGAGSVGFTAISKGADSKRIPTLLGVLDYLAAPFGTEERLFLENGAEGTHHKRTGDGDVVLTDKGNAEALTTAMPLAFLANAPEYLYLPGKSDLTRRIHGWQQELLKIGQASPVIGHYSDTNADKGASLTKALNDGVLDIIAGRKSLSDFDGLLKSWRSGGGDRIRREYEESLASEKKGKQGKQDK
ncbi:extracellular solute-binding protein [Streptomyces buecherae]|uniref:Extracellular solute-binding protein n=1 Tax=Streptomyces buecherae TaxID=2763006 RepID=A0A7H8N9S4_9ACTN|nr:extracellular solute-binding protein [Streptomyces buecherae]QKW51092.1 extracellular solute-binding protein [Streptomyces buecherae]